MWKHFEIANAMKKMQIKPPVLAVIDWEISWIIKCLFSFTIWKCSKMHLVFLMKEITLNFFSFLEFNISMIWITAFTTKSLMELFWRLVTWHEIPEQWSVCINPGNNRGKKIFKDLYELETCFDYCPTERKYFYKNSWYQKLNYKEDDIT